MQQWTWDTAIISNQSFWFHWVNTPKWNCWIIWLTYIWCLRNLHTVFHSDCASFYSYQQCPRIPVPSLFLQHVLVLVFLIIAFLTGLRWYLIVDFICVSMIISDVKHLFMYLLAFCMSSLKMSVQIPCHVLIGYFYYCVLWVFKYILNVNSLSDTWFANAFSHSVGCLFIL